MANITQTYKIMYGMQRVKRNNLTKSQDPRTWPSKLERRNVSPTVMLPVILLREKSGKLRDSRALKTLNMGN